MKDWKVIVQHQDLNNRIGEHNSPAVIATLKFEYDDKESAFKKFGELFNEYEDRSYDWKGHSFGALKFYHDYEESGNDILTYVLLYYKGEEYMEATEEDEELLDNIMDGQ